MLDAIDAVDAVELVRELGVRNVGILVSNGVGLKVGNANDGVGPESLGDGNDGGLRLKPDPLPLLPPPLPPPEPPLDPPPEPPPEPPPIVQLFFPGTQDVPS